MPCHHIVSGYRCRRIHDVVKRPPGSTVLGRFRASTDPARPLVGYRYFRRQPRTKSSTRNALTTTTFRFYRGRHGREATVDQTLVQYSPQTFDEIIIPLNVKSLVDFYIHKVCINCSPATVTSAKLHSGTSHNGFVLDYRHGRSRIALWHFLRRHHRLSPSSENCGVAQTGHGK